MADPFVAEIRIVPFNFAPSGWAFCDGQILPISQNTALFSLLGTTYGGNGTSTFALPNLQGRTLLDSGQGPGLSLRDLGETGGQQGVTLIPSEMPLHSHVVQAFSGAKGDQVSPANTLWSKAQYGRQAAPMYSATGDHTMSAQAISMAGGGLPHNNLMPYLTLNFIIALQGVFPPRS